MGAILEWVAFLESFPRCAWVRLNKVRWKDLCWSVGSVYSLHEQSPMIRWPRCYKTIWNQENRIVCRWHRKEGNWQMLKGLSSKGFVRGREELGEACHAEAFCWNDRLWANLTSVSSLLKPWKLPTAHYFLPPLFFLLFLSHQIYPNNY